MKEDISIFALPGCGMIASSANTRPDTGAIQGWHKNEILSLEDKESFVVSSVPLKQQKISVFHATITPWWALFLPTWIFELSSGWGGLLYDSVKDKPVKTLPHTHIWISNAEVFHLKGLFTASVGATKPPEPHAYYLFVCTNRFNVG